MSGTGEAAAEATLIEQDGSVPDTITPATAIDPPEPVEEAAAETPPAEAKPDDKTPKAKPWFQQRIDELTRQKGEEKRAREAVEARLKALEAAKEASAEPADSTAAPLTREAFEAAVKTEAARMAQQESANKRAQVWLNAGVTEFGMAEFNDRCALVASMGADERPEFMQIVTDPDIMPDGHKVVAMLADHPQEAQRILQLPPIQMAAALTRFATQAKPEPKAISGAPKPITPIGGSAKASSTPSDDDPIDVWMAKRAAQATARRAAKAN